MVLNRMARSERESQTGLLCQALSTSSPIASRWGGKQNAKKAQKSYKVKITLTPPQGVEIGISATPAKADTAMLNRITVRIYAAQTPVKEPSAD
jgi:hypothetical protein